MNRPPIDTNRRTSCPHCDKATRWRFATHLAPAEACEVCHGLGTVTPRESAHYYRYKKAQKPIVIPPYRAGSYKGVNPDDIPF